MKTNEGREQIKMNLFTIDNEKCNKDGICSKVCPVGIIDFDDEKNIPAPAEKAEEICIECGHCVAVCPTGALSHKSMKPEQCPDINHDLRILPDQIEHLFRSRRSIRCYRDKDVDKDLLIKLINMSRFAPSGHNSQPVKWKIVYQKNDVKEHAGLVVDWMKYFLDKKPKMALQMQLDRVVSAWEKGVDRVCRHAPHIIITYAEKQDSTAPAACIIALSYLELAASAANLGACWAGYYNMAAASWPPLQDALKLPDEHRCFGAMLIGYPEFKYKRMPLRNEPNITWC